MNYAKGWPCRTKKQLNESWVEIEIWFSPQQLLSDSHTNTHHPIHFTVNTQSSAVEKNLGTSGESTFLGMETSELKSESWEE